MVSDAYDRTQSAVLWCHAPGKAVRLDVREDWGFYPRGPSRRRIRLCQVIGRLASFRRKARLRLPLSFERDRRRAPNLQPWTACDRIATANGQIVSLIAVWVAMVAPDKRQVAETCAPALHALGLRIRLFLPRGTDWILDP